MQRWKYNVGKWGGLAWIYIDSVFYFTKVWAEDMVVPVMFVTTQRQLWSENLKVAEGNPFTRLPQGLPVGCLIQDIDSKYSSLAPKITYWFTLLTVVSWKLNHSNLHCHIKWCECCFHHKHQTSMCSKWVQWPLCKVLSIIHGML